MRFLLLFMVVVFSSAHPAISQEQAEKIDSLEAVEFKEKAPQNVTAAAVYYTCRDYFEHKFNSAARENVGRKSSCVSYFFGAGSMLLLLNNENVHTEVCLPPESSTEDLIRLFNKWMAKHAAESDKEIATVVLLNAIRDAYPCEAVVPLGSN